MVDRMFGAALADFVIEFGELADIITEAGTPAGGQGHLVLVPRPTGESEDPLITIKVFDAPSGTQLVDLLDADANEVDVLTVPNTWLHMGQILVFTVLDAPDGDVWLTANDSTGPWFRAMPFTAEIFARLVALEEGRATVNLTDWSDTPAEDGQFAQYDAETGQWTPVDVIPGGLELGDLTNVDDTGAEAGQALVKLSGGGYAFATLVATATWASVTGKPTTFPPVVGAGPADAKPGDWLPGWDDVQDKPANLLQGLILGPSDPIPGGTPAETLIIRTVS